MYLSHIPNILAISQISKSFSTFLSHFSTYLRNFIQILVISHIIYPFFKYLSHFPNIYVISHIFKPFVKFLCLFQHSKPDSQILKLSPMYPSHFRNILDIFQISMSFSTFSSRLSNNYVISPHISAISHRCKSFPTLFSRFSNT